MGQLISGKILWVVVPTINGLGESISKYPKGIAYSRPLTQLTKYATDLYPVAARVSTLVRLGVKSSRGITAA